MPETLTLTRTDFDSAEHFGTAGTITALSEPTVTRWREQHPDWKAKHWRYSDPDQHGARFLHPINVAARTKN
ncbi:hypothetical protein [Nocardia vinacea]|uniref:hypothetical protein n=1 Tax=Nocardia vinacea TaxID=96468 RepID=UPI0002EFC0F1|nr:hypothetical protein [Nocardia vinacea]